MLGLLFHAWEHRLAAIAKDRVVRPFEWGIEWMTDNGHFEGDDLPRAEAYVREILEDTPRWFSAPGLDRCDVASGPGDGSRWVTFPTARPTPHPENNTVVARYFPGRSAPGTKRGRRAVLVLPQWNSDPEGHVGLCRLLARFGMSALRLSLPYHDRRMPPELSRADYIVSSNVLRTLEVCRQAVLDARRAIQWLAHEGYDRIGILGTSLGSCLAMLTACHEPLVNAQALNHISPYFADVVWRGLSTRHVRTGLDGHVSLETLRRLWLPISPQHYLPRLQGTAMRTLLVYAKYDLTFPVDLSRQLVRDFRRHRIPHQLAILPCGHYSTGSAPFKYMAGAVLTRFLDKAL